MLAADRFTVATVGDVACGHLMLLEVDGVRHFALRVTVPHVRAPQCDGALVLQFRFAAEARRSVALDNAGDTTCIDLGQAEVRISAEAMLEAMPGDWANPGELLIDAHGPAILGNFGPAGGSRYAWTVRDGSPVNVQPQRQRFKAWTIGIQQDGAFVPLVTFPLPAVDCPV